MSLAVSLSEEQLEELATRIADKLSPANRQPLNVAQASKALGVSRWVVESRVHSGEIQRVPHTGRRILIPRAEIERLQSGESIKRAEGRGR